MTRPGILLATLLFFPSTAAEATITRAVQFEEKVENAASIILGKCISQQAQWDTARNWILTYTTFEVESTLKGAPAQRVTIVTPGGVVGSVAQEVIGVPRFRQGEEHVVFLRDSQAGPTVAFLEQGAYRVVKNERGDRMVTPAVSSAVLVDTGRGMAVSPESARPLREFTSEVRESVRKREVIRMEMLEREKKEEASLWNHLSHNKTLVALALIGILLASWQFYKRW